MDKAERSQSGSKNCERKSGSVRRGFVAAVKESSEHEDPSAGFNFLPTRPEIDAAGATGADCDPASG